MILSDLYDFLQTTAGRNKTVLRMPPPEGRFACPTAEGKRKAVSASQALTAGLILSAGWTRETN
jgi:hypothetical protein